MIIALTSQIFDVLADDDEELKLLITRLREENARRLIENAIEAKNLVIFPFQDDNMVERIAGSVDERLRMNGKLRDYARVKTIAFGKPNYVILFSPEKGFWRVEIDR